jgi:hypothetical protein
LPLKRPVTGEPAGELIDETTACARAVIEVRKLG